MVTGTRPGTAWFGMVRTNFFCTGIGKTDAARRPAGRTCPGLYHSIRNGAVAAILFAALCIFLPAASGADTVSDVGSLLKGGNDCFSRGDYACAWSSFETAHALAPNNSGILYTYSRLLYKAGETNAAIEKIDAALSLDSQNAQMWLMKGRMLNAVGRFLESDACFDRAIAIDPVLKVRATERFPLNLVMAFGAGAFVIAGLSFLVLYIYFREVRRKKGRWKG